MAKTSLKSVHIDKRYLKIIWNDDTVSRFPHIFLRDSCKCPQCSTQQTIVNTIVEFGLDIVVKKASISEHGTNLTCVWPDGHESAYPIDFLFETRMPESPEEREDEKNLDDLVKDELLLWNRETMQDKVCYAVANKSVSYRYDTHEYASKLVNKRSHNWLIVTGTT